jgi:hypothetical protein
MSSTRWQYSLAALMTFVAIAAVGCAIAGLVGYALLLSIAPIISVFWATYRINEEMMKTGNRNSLPARYREPVEVDMHLNGGFTKLRLSRWGGAWDIPTRLISYDLRPIGTHFTIAGEFFRRHATIRLATFEGNWRIR